jgi:large subunit ribosomal protein L18
MANKSRADIRRGVHSRIRKKVQGTSERPRLAVFRSVKHIYAQIIDDVKGVTLAAASTTEGGFKGKTGGNIEAAQTVGKMIAERAVDAGIDTVVFDRGGYVYHGRVKALIDASREAGLNRNGVAAASAGKDEKQAETEPKAEEKKSSEPKKKESKAEGKKEKPAKKESKAEDKKETAAKKKSEEPAEAAEADEKATEEEE